MARVLVAVPTFENIYPDTYKALWDMDKAGHDVGFEFVRGYDCATARNNIAKLAMDGGWDYVLMVDNDVTVPKDALANLIGHGVDFVSGYYPHRDKDNSLSDRTCLCKLGQFDYTWQYTAQELEDMRNRGEHLVRIHGGGMGCALVRTDVFGRIAYPYFDWVNYQDAKHSMLSEDLFFCERCHFEGIPLYADTRVSCGHMFRTINRF